jgi:hypothetical protein
MNKAVIILGVSLIVLAGAEAADLKCAEWQTTPLCTFLQIPVAAGSR